MSTVPASLDRRVSSVELALWGVLVVIAGAVPGLGLVAGLVLGGTRLRGHRTARVVLPVLGALATVFWAAGIFGGFEGGSAGPVTRP